jgi:hypothetical protein
MVIDQLEMDELTTAVENEMEATVAEISSDDDNTDAEEAEEDEAEEAEEEAAGDDSEEAATEEGEEA